MAGLQSYEKILTDRLKLELAIFLEDEKEAMRGSGRHLRLFSGESVGLPVEGEAEKEFSVLPRGGLKSKALFSLPPPPPLLKPCVITGLHKKKYIHTHQKIR